MPAIFVSHASADDGYVRAIEAWFQSNGFTDYFADHSSIIGGQKWRDALRDSVGACRVMLCVVTKNWLESPECFNEFRAAWYMGKQILPLFILPKKISLSKLASEQLTEVRAEYQGIDLYSSIDAKNALDIEAAPELSLQLKKALRAFGGISVVGLDPEAFEVDRSVCPSPFPGLSSFGDDDAHAALFYGRSSEIAETLETLRSMRAMAGKKPLIILGDSGAGKSSLLKAGIIPRLRRERPAWLPLRALRPGGDPLFNFAEAVARTFLDFSVQQSAGFIRDRLFSVWSEADRETDSDELSESGIEAVEKELEALGKKLRTAANALNSTIVVSIDQTEELAREDSASGDALASYLHIANTSKSSQWQLVFTTRTDSFAEVQRHRRFQALQSEGYDLRAIEAYHFDDVIEAPAKRYGVHVEPALIQGLMEDQPERDALPLLAFAMERLWRRYADSGVLSLENFQAVGGLKAFIEDAGERALHGIEAEHDVAIRSGSLPKSEEELAASVFVPLLVQLNDNGEAIRRVSNWSSFSRTQQEILDRFVSWRLLVRRGTTEEESTVEVVHETLFRAWGRLKAWLEPERENLDTLRAVTVAAGEWERSGKKASYLTHTEKRLSDAAALNEDERFRTLLGEMERDYIAAAQRHERRNRALVMIAIAASIAAILGVWNKKFFADQYFLFTQIWPHVTPDDVEPGLADFKPFWDCSKTGQHRSRDYSMHCPGMVPVPKGEFVMGSPEGKMPGTEKEYPKDEKPQRKVSISYRFAVSRYELTAEQWQTCVAYGTCTEADGDGRHPVTQVDWTMAQEYVSWMSAATGKRYRLLTEAEWEYVARAGTQTDFYFPDEPTEYCKFANFGDLDSTKRKENPQCHDGYGDQTTAEVGSFEPNDWGLYDTAGNVWSWVEDSWHPNYRNGPPSDGTAWVAKDKKDLQDAGGTERRVVRGGSYVSRPSYLRSANRDSDPASLRSGNVGIRIARDLAQ